MQTQPQPQPLQSQPFKTKGDLVALLTNRLALNDYELTDAIFPTDLLPDPTSIELVHPSPPPSPSSSLVPTSPTPTPTPIDTSDPNNFDSISLDQIYKSYIPLSYADGFPTQPDGMPFWERLTFEPPRCFEAFKLYLQQGNDSARQIHLLNSNPDHPNANRHSSHSHSHSHPDVGEDVKEDVGEDVKEDVKERVGEDVKSVGTREELFEWANLYYWRLRSRAFDLFQAAFERHLRSKRAIQFQDDSYLTSLRLANVAEAYLNSPAFAAEMSPKVALEALRLSQQMGRDALGLSKTGRAGGGNSNGSNNDGITIDIRTELRRLGVPQDAIDPKVLKELEKRGLLSAEQKKLLRNNTAGISGTIIDAETGEVEASNNTDQILEEFLKNELLASTAQDIVLNISVNKHQNQD